MKDMMEKRKHPGFGKTYFLQNIYRFIPLVLLFWLSWSNFSKMNAVFWISLMSFVLGVIGYLVWERRRIKMIRCPNCHGLLTQATISSPKEGDPINYCCFVCRIEWETGLRQAD
jgi:hypothetical protein